MFKDKTLLITGGTGSFGNAVLNRFLNSDLKEIRIFSRDEKKQDDMRRRYGSSKLKFYIGDVRDYQSLLNATNDVDYIFHAAALKQVPSCEFHPMEAVKTNIYGTENVLNAGIYSGVKRIICLSTDKAVYPINAMGISKSMMEKVAVAKSRNSTSTVICVTIHMGNKITVTDPMMTRFMMTLEEAVDLVLYAFQNGKTGEVFVQKAPGATIGTLANALLEIFNSRVVQDVIGTRHGEKLYEVLLSREEMSCAIDCGDYYCVPPDLRDLNYGKFVEKGEVEISKSIDYNSHNTNQLDINAMKTILLKLPAVQGMLKKSI